MTDWQLTPEQEQFLRQLFELCDRYSDHGVICSSIGTEGTDEQRFYRLLAEIQLARSPHITPTPANRDNK